MGSTILPFFPTRQYPYTYESLDNSHTFLAYLRDMSHRFRVIKGMMTHELSGAPGPL